MSYRAGDLVAERTRTFEQHLQSCADCRRLVRDAAALLTDVDRTVKKAESRANPVDAILARLRRTATERAAHPRGRTPRQPSQRFWLPVAGVLAVVVLVAVLQLVLALWSRRWHVSTAQMPAGPVVGPSAR